jgi:hypothetical protein
VDKNPNKSHALPIRNGSLKTEVVHFDVAAPVFDCCVQCHSQRREAGVDLLRIGFVLTEYLNLLLLVDALRDRADAHLVHQPPGGVNQHLRLDLCLGLAETTHQSPSGPITAWHFMISLAN